MCRDCAVLERPRNRIVSNAIRCRCEVIVENSDKAQKLRGLLNNLEIVIARSLGGERGDGQ